MMRLLMNIKGRGNRAPTTPDILFGLVLIVACLVRPWRITQIPHTLWVDEAWFSQRARDVVRGINFIPIARPGLGVGDSPMQVYLAAFVQLLGLPAAYSSRIASCLVGMITVGIMYPALATIWREEHGEETARWMALIATSVLGGLFAHIYASRMGNQYALAPAFVVITMWLVWKALANERTDGRPRIERSALSGISWAVGAGVALGLSQYTYESTRVLPILVGVFGLLRILQANRTGGGRRRTAVRVGIIVATCILVLVPLALVYIQDPEVYVLHMRECSSGILSGAPLEVLVNVLKNYGRVLGGISLRGDVMPGRNLVGRPMLDLFLSLLCWLGVGVALARIRRSPSSQLLVLWLGTMLLPSALSDQAPASNRMLGAAPALAALVALGMAWLWKEQIPRLVHSHGERGQHARLVQQGAGVLLAAGLVLSQAEAIYDYFAHWATDPRLFDALSMGPRLLADRALELAQTDQVYLTPASDPFIEPVYDLLLEGSIRSTGAETRIFGKNLVSVLDAHPCLPYVDHPTRPVDYGVVTVADHQSLPRLKSAYPSGRELDAIMHPDGYAYAVVFQVPAGTPGPVPQHPARTEFAGGPTLIGYDLSPASAHPGEVLHLVLYWSATSAPMDDLVSFVHVGKGRYSDPLIANHDAQICGHTYPTSRWSAGEVILDEHLLTVGDDAMPDTYDIAVGVYRASDQTRLDVTQSEHPAQDNRVMIGTVTVVR